DFYLGYSFVWSGQTICKLAVLPPGTGLPQVANFLGVNALLQLAPATTTSAKQFRVAYTPQQGSTYDGTYVSEVSWPTISAPALISPSGRTAQALDYRRSSSPGNYVGIHIIYDHKLTATYEWASDYGAVPPPGLPT